MVHFFASFKIIIRVDWHCQTSRDAVQLVATICVSDNIKKIFHNSMIIFFLRNVRKTICHITEVHAFTTKADSDLVASCQIPNPYLFISPETKLFCNLCKMNSV